MERYIYSENQAKDYAKEISKSVVIRTMKDGSSSDDRREATKAEAELVERAVASALIAIRAGYDESAAKVTAEHFVCYGSNYDCHINTYDSVYLPIGDFLRQKAARLL